MLFFGRSCIFTGVFVAYVHAHGALVGITGANGVQAAGFGIIGSTPRDGSTPKPFEQDTSVIRDREISSGKVGVCGKTPLNGNNDVTSQLANATAAGLPTASADGTVTMTLHQVNGDGAGPYTCQVSSDATGSDFQDMTVITNVPGVNSRSKAKATDFPLVAKLPAGITCTGGPSGNACLVRCRNSANAGPFGGCAAVTTSDSASATSNSTSTDSSDAASTDSSDESSDAESDDSSAVVSTASSDAEAVGDGDAGEEKAGKVKGAAKKGGRLAKLLRSRDQQKRMMTSRIVGKRQSGKWI